MKTFFIESIFIDLKGAHILFDNVYTKEVGPYFPLFLLKMQQKKNRIVSSYGQLPSLFFLYFNLPISNSFFFYNVHDFLEKIHHLTKIL